MQEGERCREVAILLPAFVLFFLALVIYIAVFRRSVPKEVRRPGEKTISSSPPNRTV